MCVDPPPTSVGSALKWQAMQDAQVPANGPQSSVRPWPIWCQHHRPHRWLAWRIAAPLCPCFCGHQKRCYRPSTYVQVQPSACLASMLCKLCFAGPRMSPFSHSLSAGCTPAELWKPPPGQALRQTSRPPGNDHEQHRTRKDFALLRI